MSDADFKRELERAYRALHGFYNCHIKGEQPSPAMLAYHSPTIAAARRFVNEGALDGADYFIGKHVSVLHAAFSDGFSTCDCPACRGERERVAG